MELVQRLMALFVGNDTHHGTHGEPDRDPNGGVKWTIRRTAKTLKTAPTERLWEDHVKGVKPLGVVPITSENTCSWGSIDYDEYDVDLMEVIAKVRKAKLPLVPCRSKSGGLHLWLFTTEPVEAGKMQSALREMAASIGLGASEIFPKQVKLLSDRGDQGSWMVMPYYGGTFNDKLQYQHGLKDNGAEMTLNEFLREAEKAKVTPEQLEELSLVAVHSAPKKGSKAAKGKGNGKESKPRLPFGDGPPCLTHMCLSENGIEQGGQNNVLAHMSVYFKRKHPDDWVQKLEEANHDFCQPPHPAGGMDTLIKSMGKKEYQYMCKTEPMASHCDAMQCRMKKFGVGAGGTYPIITSLKKLKSDPPVWFVDVEGEKFELSTDELQNYVKFHKLCMEHVNKSFAMIRADVWLGLVGEAMANMTEIEDLAPDAGTTGEFMELLETYLTNKQRGTKEEDLLSGRPWENEEEGRHYFQLSRLKRYLEREGFKEMKKGSVASRIMNMGGGFIGRQIKGKFRNLHWLPSALFQEMPEIDPPPTKGSPI